MFRKILLYLLAATLLYACEKQPFSVNTRNREDVTILYGLLNPADTLHYIKVYKGFLTEGNAYEAAKDLHNYSYIDSIDVYMEEYQGDAYIRTINFDTTTAIPKDSGTFAYPLQVLYSAPANLQQDCRYVLYVKNKYSPKIVRSETSIVGSLFMTRPAITLSKEINILEQQQLIRFRAANSIYYCEVLMHYHYTESMKDGSNRHGVVSWKVGGIHGQANPNSTIMQELTVSYQGYQFFQKIGSGITDDPEVRSRHTDSIVIQIYKTGEEMYKYLLASSASTGLNQERLTYTNIYSYASPSDMAAGKSDGLALGLFSTSGSDRFTFRDLGTISRDSLFHGRFTKHLKFTDIY